MSAPSLEGPRATVLHALVSLCTTGEPEVAAATLGLGTTQAAEVTRNAGLRYAPTARADRVYSGVLYEVLDLASLDGAARRRATRWLAITSGLFGLVRTSDHIPAYRLSGDVALPGVGTVSTFWNRHLDEPVREAAGRGLVVDLRSSTYAAFWRPDPAIARRVVTLRVLHEAADGNRTVVSHFNKATKGAIVRALLLDGGNPTTPTGFARQLTGLGWRVEAGGTSRHGTRLDVVVTQVDGQRPMNAASIGRALNSRRDACPSANQDTTVTEAAASSIR